MSGPLDVGEGRVVVSVRAMNINGKLDFEELVLFMPIDLIDEHVRNTISRERIALFGAKYLCLEIETR